MSPFPNGSTLRQAWEACPVPDAGPRRVHRREHGRTGGVMSEATARGPPNLHSQAAWDSVVSTMKVPRCKIHNVRLICPACVGAAGGATTSKEKAQAARANGRLGG